MFLDKLVIALLAPLGSALALGGVALLLAALGRRGFAWLAGSLRRKQPQLQKTSKSRDPPRFHPQRWALLSSQPPLPYGRLSASEPPPKTPISMTRLFC